MKYTFFLLVIYGLVTYFNEYNNLASNNSLGKVNIRLFLPFSDEAKLGSYFVRLYGLFLALYFVKEKKISLKIFHSFL